MASDLIPVVQKSYDLCAGLYTYVNRFPRAQRGLLGRVMLEDALQKPAGAPDTPRDEEAERPVAGGQSGRCANSDNFVGCR